MARTNKATQNRRAKSPARLASSRVMKNAMKKKLMTLKKQGVTRLKVSK